MYLAFTSFAYVAAPSSTQTYDIFCVRGLLAVKKTVLSIVCSRNMIPFSIEQRVYIIQAYFRCKAGVMLNMQQYRN